ncbi:GDP-mannose 4,6-dehydratase [Hymenobacter lapidarius]|uniref:GDP-mannose 4,6-dehydratase n=1 Tax=Hymenobacter lapidarius TaxID=1908237 RepID=UPI001EFAC2CE|nr:GDP-mannose 4,6-dehydratase [Hymenobacter lapidarius]
MRGHQARRRAARAHLPPPPPPQAGRPERPVLHRLRPPAAPRPGHSQVCAPAARRLRAGQVIPVFGDGSTARDYTYVADTVDGIARGVRYLLDHTGVFETVNLGNHHPVPLLELIAAVGHAVGVKPELTFQPMQAGDVDITSADISKAQHLFGYAPPTSLAEGLRQFAAWLAAA